MKTFDWASAHLCAQTLLTAGTIAASGNALYHGWHELYLGIAMALPITVGAWLLTYKSWKAKQALKAKPIEPEVMVAPWNESEG